MKRLFTAILLAALFILSGCKKEQQIEEPPRTDIDPENAKYDQESLEYTYDWGEHSVPAMPPPMTKKVRLAKSLSFGVLLVTPPSLS